MKDWQNLLSLLCSLLLFCSPRAYAQLAHDPQRDVSVTFSSRHEGEDARSRSSTRPGSARTVQVLQCSCRKNLQDFSGQFSGTASGHNRVVPTKHLLHGKGFHNHGTSPFRVKRSYPKILRFRRQRVWRQQSSGFLSEPFIG